MKHGLCLRCYMNWRATKAPDRPTCIFAGCPLPLWAKGYCSSHYQQFKRYGEARPLKPQQRGRIRKMTGERFNTGGYRLVFIKDRGWILEHRHVMEQKLGRYLMPGENVHHINGDKLNNDPDNLELWVVRQPQGQRVEDLLKWAHGIIKRYG